MAVIQTLYSGSAGNCTLIRDAGTVLLVDMGKNCKETLTALYKAGVSAKDISGILVTHEHSDHISGLRVFLKHYPVPLFGSTMTLEFLHSHMMIGECDTVAFEPGEEIMVGGLSFTGFRTSHDSLDCLGYRFLFENGTTAAVATDLGCVCDSVKENLRDCDFIGLESNYDVEMLRFGGYPRHLKQRIASRSGHLSNIECAEALAFLAVRGTKRLMLMHLSQHNNAPELALTTCLVMLENQGAEDCSVYVAPRHDIGEAIEVL